MATDRSGFRYQTRDLSRNEKIKLNMILLDLRNKYPTEYSFVMIIQDHIYTRISPSALAEYYKGAHIVFNDKGKIYAELRQFAVAPETTSFYRYAKDSQIPKSERHQPFQLSSHYTVATGYPSGDENDYPQYGIDLPTGGHILFGLVPDENGVRANGNTFVQTEGYGFQNLRSVAMHGWGFVMSVTGMGNTGLLGCSPHTESCKREIREHERDHIPYEQLLFEARMPPFDWGAVRHRVANFRNIDKRQDTVVKHFLESGLEESEFEHYVDPDHKVKVDVEYRCPRTGGKRIYLRH